MFSSCYTHDRTSAISFLPAYVDEFWEFSISHFKFVDLLFFCFHLKTIFIHNLVSWRILQFSKINSIKWNPKPTYQKYKILCRQTNYNDLNKIPTWQLFTSISPAMVEN